MTTKTAAKKVATTEAPTASATPTPCKCNCGQATVRQDAFYVSGHDARHAGQVGRALAATTSSDEIKALLATLPTDKLREKALGVNETAQRKATEKAAKVAAREAGKAAAAKVLADAQV